jgi:5-methylcytosine-specific restriction protein B
MSSRLDRDMVEKISDWYTKLNKFMLENLWKDFQIWHSYFIPQWFDIDNYWVVYKDIVEYEIKPLLEEYFYDDPNKVQEALNIINFDL